MGAKLTITSTGLIKVDRSTREQVYWDGTQIPSICDAPIVFVDDTWVKYGYGRNDRFRNPRVAGGFIVNSTELRAVNFSMEAVGQPPLQVRSRGRRAAIVSAPLPKKYQMHSSIDADIRARCW